LCLLVDEQVTLAMLGVPLDKAVKLMASGRKRELLDTIADDDMVSAGTSLQFTYSLATIVYEAYEQL
jgi:hypothetical protein